MINKNFSLLYYDIAISTYANNFGAFLISWLVYDLTGSKLAMGGLWMVIITTQLLVQFIVGPYLDNWQRKKIMIISEIFRLIVFLAILFLALFGELNIFVLYASSFLITIVFYDPAASALIPSIVPKDDLIKANAKFSGIQQFMRIFGILSAGLVAIIGHISALFLVIVLLCISIILINNITEKGKIINERQPWLQQFKKGTVIYKKQPILLYLGAFLAISNFGIFAAQTMYIPFVYENLKGDSISYGLFAASWPLGFVIGSILLSKIPEFSFPVKARLMILSLVVGGVTFIFLAYTTELWVAILLEVLAGISGPFWNVYSSQLYQVLVPDNIRAQVFSVRFLIGKCAAPLGILFGTFIATTLGINMLFIIIGLSTTIVTLIGYIFMSNFSKTIHIHSELEDVNA